jgi:hypothetical protein
MVKTFVTDEKGIIDDFEITSLNGYLAGALARQYVALHIEQEQGTVNIHVYTTRFSRKDGEILREWWIKVAVQPEEPCCVDLNTDHEWISAHSIVDKSPEKFTDVCSKCGIYRNIICGVVDKSGQLYNRIEYENFDVESLNLIEKNQTNINIKCNECDGRLFELKTDNLGFVTINCIKCKREIESRYVKEEMLYFSKREGYRIAYGEIEDFIEEKQDNDMVEYLP